MLYLYVMHLPFTGLKDEATGPTAPAINPAMHPTQQPELPEMPDVEEREEDDHGEEEAEEEEEDDDDEEGETVEEEEPALPDRVAKTPRKQGKLQHMSKCSVNPAGRVRRINIFLYTKSHTKLMYLMHNCPSGR